MEPEHLAVDGEGRIVVALLDSAAGIVVQRLLGDGAPDPAFASAGVFANGSLKGRLQAGSSGLGFAIAPGGTILVGGYVDADPALDGGGDHVTAAVMRLRSDGTVDSTFGGGLVRVQDRPRAVAAAPTLVADAACNRVIVAIDEPLSVFRYFL